MSRLVVQHPQLTEHAVAAFRAALGRAPTLHLPQLATWEPVNLDGERVGELADALGVDAEIVPVSTRLSDYRLLTCDMDSTLITIECIDEMADYAGRKREVAAITEAAMRGEIANFADSLRRRVALLEGLPESVLQRVHDERMRLSPGAEALILAARAAGLKMLLVSGGFSFFSERLAARLGIDFAHANRLEIEHGRLTGRVLGDIVDADAKRRLLEETCRHIGCTPSEAIVVGDGANDLKMMSIAGVSVAYRAKPQVRTETMHAINHCGLDAILNWFVDQLPTAA
ncbi:MAG: phosphoserine phosphatase SerB [Burkholderiaceae bacterium]|nr:phosphoserine phosphatase SerB [Burkholderiaceae bacterium]